MRGRTAKISKCGEVHNAAHPLKSCGGIGIGADLDRLGILQSGTQNSTYFQVPIWVALRCMGGLVHTHVLEALELLHTL